MYSCGNVRYGDVKGIAAHGGTAYGKGKARRGFVAVRYSEVRWR